MTVTNGASKHGFPIFSCVLICPTEPGYYKDGGYGIRIENVLLVREAQTPNNFGDKGYLCFENVTMVRTPSSESAVRASNLSQRVSFVHRYRSAPSKQSSSHKTFCRPLKWNGSTNTTRRYWPSSLRTFRTIPALLNGSRRNVLRSR